MRGPRTTSTGRVADRSTELDAAEQRTRKGGAREETDLAVCTQKRRSYRSLNREMRPPPTPLARYGAMHASSSQRVPR